MRSIITGCSGTIVVNLAIPAPLQKDLEAMEAISYFHTIKKSRIKRDFFQKCNFQRCISSHIQPNSNLILYFLKLFSPCPEGDKCHQRLIQSSFRLNITESALWSFITLNAYVKCDLYSVVQAKQKLNKSELFSSTWYQRQYLP